MKKWVGVFFFFIVLLVCSNFLFNQEQYGHIRGVVIDDEGSPLPGVKVLLETEFYAARAAITSSNGIFRFINITPGIFQLKCKPSGFKTYIQDNINIRVGTNFDFEIRLELESVEEDVTVVAVSPIVDTKKVGTSTNVTEVLLQEIPSARDPWVILKQVPGIQMKEENVGGSHSGKQVSFIGRGTFMKENVWNIDGIPTTDMKALGFSPNYYDFDIFEEIQVVTGGADASVQTGGVSINFITRRGGNKYQVMTRAFFSDDSLQGDNRTQEIKALDYAGNRITQILDYGFQIGGPIKRDQIWFWLGYGVQDIRRLSIDGYPDEAVLKGINFKMNFRLSPDNRAEIALVSNRKFMDGRGAGPFRAPETTVDQKPINDFPYIKVEDEHTFSKNFLLSAKLSYFNPAFGWDPKGGFRVAPSYDRVTRMCTDSYPAYRASRPSWVTKLDGNYFRENFLGGNHEFKFGFAYRSTDSEESLIYPQGYWRNYINGNPYAIEVYRNSNTRSSVERFSFYLNDAFSIGRLTLNLSLRLDREKGIVNETNVEANPIAPELLPDMTFPEVDPKIVLWMLSPRLGFNIDLTGDRKTFLRCNLARYNSQMGHDFIDVLSAAKIGYAAWFWEDLNGDDQASQEELLGYPLQGLLVFSGFDPFNPASIDSPDVIDPNIKSPLTDEFILGLERELIPDLSLGANLIFRRTHRTTWQLYYDKGTGTKITQDDYIGPIERTLEFNGQNYTYKYWTLNKFRPSGTILTNNPDLHIDYKAFEINAVKRLSRRWMMNASFTYNIFTNHYGESGFEDPTNIEVLDGGRAVDFGADWMGKMSLLYQLPYGFNLSFFTNIRQGNIFNKQIQVSTPERSQVGLGPLTTIYLEKPGTSRLPTFYNFDFSLSKELKLGDYGRLIFQVDAFNLFNSAHTLDRVNQVNSPRYQEITEILNPRVIRFGVRYRY